MHCISIALLLGACSQPKVQENPTELVRQSMFIEKMLTKCRAELSEVKNNTDNHQQALLTQQNRCNKLELRQKETRAKAKVSDSEWQKAYNEEWNRQHPAPSSSSSR